MISKLRKKLMLVLMCVMCTFLAFILVSMLAATFNSNELRRYEAVSLPMQEWEKRPSDGNENSRARRPVTVPVALAVVNGDGSVHVSRNQLYYITDEELADVVLALEEKAEDAGTASQYEMRYVRRTRDGHTLYSFTDTTLERQMFAAQLRFSAVAAVCAILLFVLVSYFLSRWMVRPVERVWEKQRQFIADASHELKTPLTVILSNTDMLINSGAVADEKNQMRLDNIRAESQRMKGLVENLLMLAHSDHKGNKTQLVAVNFSFCITSATLAMEPAVYDAGRALEMKIEEDLFIRGSDMQVHQLVEILLDNARKYSDPGSRIVLELCRQNKEAVLSVSSSGEPLSSKDCQNIFERFYRLDQSRSREKGYGLGLSIAHDIVSRFGGKMEASSDGVRTNTFTVRMPLVMENR